MYKAKMPPNIGLNNQPIETVYKPEPKSVVRYCLYARKSSESDERQALSIDSQIKEMLAHAERLGIHVTDIKQESHSAKSSGERPVFMQLINEIKDGQYNGILAWHPDRLSRNAGDLGLLVDLMDSNQLEAIQTYGQRFSNTPNEKFLLMILCSQAKLENDNRGINVKRGMKTKCEMGYRPNLAPLGFLNNKAHQSIHIDRKRAHYIKEMFEKVAYQGYSGRAIYQWFDKIGLKTRRGKTISYSMVFSMLNNPYYCGLFEFPRESGVWYKTKHKPLISQELFRDVQERAAVRNKPWPGKKTFDFTRILKCGSCDSGITASEKFKTSSRATHRYVYYHCTRFKNFTCKEPYIREEALVEQLEKLIDRLPGEELESNERIKYQISQFIKSRRSVIRYQQMETDTSESLDGIDAKKFGKYIMRYGTREEKHELLLSLNTNIYLKDKKVYIKKDMND